MPFSQSLSFLPGPKFALGNQEFQAPSRQASWNTTISIPYQRAVTLGTEPNPSEHAVISTGGKHPFQPSIIDFHFRDIAAGKPVVINRSSVEDVAYNIGPTAIMKDEQGSINPDLRWIHMPFNSMVHTEVLLFP